MVLQGANAHPCLPQGKWGQRDQTPGQPDTDSQESPHGSDSAPRFPPQSFLKRTRVNRAPGDEGTESGAVLLVLKSVRKFPSMSMKSGLCFVFATKKMSISLLHPFPGRSGHCLVLLASTPKTKTHFGLLNWKDISGRTDCWFLSWFWSCFLQKMNKTVKSFYSKLFCSDFTSIWKNSHVFVKKILKTLVSEGLGGGRIQGNKKILKYCWYSCNNKLPLEFW